MSESKTRFDDEVDALYKLPIAEFTAARNTLATRLKQGGRRNEAELVKALVKPSSSAWAVNQLYWNHRDAFDRLIATGERFREAQNRGSRARRQTCASSARCASQGALERFRIGKCVAARCWSQPDAGYYASRHHDSRSNVCVRTIPDGPRPGRLAHDVDLPGFDSLASLIPSAGLTERTKEPARATQSQDSGRAAASTRQKAEAAVRQLEETRQTRITAAKVSLQEAKGLLIKARARVQTLETAQKTASADVKDAEKQRREAEKRFERAEPRRKRRLDTYKTLPLRRSRRRRRWKTLSALSKATPKSSRNVSRIAAKVNGPARSQLSTCRSQASEGIKR